MPVIASHTEILSLIRGVMGPRSEKCGLFIVKNRSSSCVECFLTLLPHYGSLFCSFLMAVFIAGGLSVCCSGLKAPTLETFRVFESGDSSGRGMGIAPRLCIMDISKGKVLSNWELRPIRTKLELVVHFCCFPGSVLEREHKLEA